jgi:hypothetical protein
MYKFGVRSIGEKWRCMDESKFEIFKNNCIRLKTSGYQTVYSFKDINREYPIFNCFFLDFDSDTDPEAAIDEALSIGGKLVESFDFSKIEIIRSGGKGAHLIVFFKEPLEGDSLDSKFCNEIHSYYYDFIKSEFSPKYLCESCREPIRRLKRIPGTVHESGNMCVVIKEFVGVGSRSCVNECLKRLHDDVVSRPLNLNLNVSSNEDGIDFADIDLREVFRALRPDLVVKSKGDDLLVLHPCHPDSSQEHNGICFSTNCYCYSEQRSTNFFETVKLLLGTEDNATVMKYLNDNFS